LRCGGTFPEWVMELTCLFIAVASFIATVGNPQLSAGSCPNLSGRYVLQGEDGRVLIAIKQDRCRKVTIKWGGDDVGHGLPDNHRSFPRPVWSSRAPASQPCSDRAAASSSAAVLPQT
jgi:hypothetical protein